MKNSYSWSIKKSILGLAIFIASFGTYYMLIKQQPENPQL